VGDIELQIPKLRTGSYLPSVLDPRRRVDKALYAVIMAAYINGVSTRKVERWWRPLAPKAASPSRR
jgi:putative transposase